MVTTRHRLLTSSWTADVQAVESAVGRLAVDIKSPNDCHVVCFELVGDEHLHVNVTHRYQTRAVRGWAGPGRLPQGFVHNRTFGERQSSQMVRHIRDMV